MRRIPKPARIALSLLAFVVVAAPATARADCRERSAGEYCYSFDDDLLNSDVASPNAARIVGRPQPVRVRLIRPRSHFIAELYESVEHI